MKKITLFLLLFLGFNLTAQNTPLTVTLAITQPPCYPGTGFIQISAIGGQAPYQYSIDNNPFQSSNIFNNLFPGTYYAYTKDALGATVALPFTIIAPAPITASITISNNDIIVNAIGGNGTSYLYSINNGPQQTSNIFTNLPIGIYKVTVLDSNGCFLSLEGVVNVAPPIIGGGDSSPITLTFTAGNTLADIVVQGNNINWYSTPGTLKKSANKTNQTIAEIPLQLTTVLVNNTTYYASQTINGFESQKRLAVTVKLNTLGIESNVFNNFKYFPNPLQDSFNVSNSNVIDAVSIDDLSGKTILSININALESELDLSTFSNGIYFVKIQSEGLEKVIKVVKE
jgi:hypothetical protein